MEAVKKQVTSQKHVEEEKSKKRKYFRNRATSMLDSIIDGSGITYGDISEANTKDQSIVKKKRRINFISESEFKRLARQQPIPWSSLSRECIYKLEWVNTADKLQIAGNLTDSEGTTVSVLLPKFVVDRLLAITESNVRIYVKPKGEDKVDIAILEKHLCKDCNKEFASRTFLQRHVKRSCTARVQKIVDAVVAGEYSKTL